MSYYNHSASTIEKIEKFGKSFDQLTKETVKAFLKMHNLQILKSRL